MSSLAAARRRRRTGRAAAPRARDATTPRSRSSSTATWLEGTPRRRDRRMGDRPRAPRRARRASRVRRPRRRRHPRARLGAARREEHEARAAAAREIDPDASTSRGRRPDQGRPPGRRSTAALDAYRDAMVRARSHLHRPRPGHASPTTSGSTVIETPEYLRNVIPFAAYFEPATFDDDPKGIYIVTPSVDDDPNAMREHNLASISNTSIHEAYPGPPPPARRGAAQSVADPPADRRPRVRRGLGDVLRAADARAGLRRRARASGSMLHTDAIWRACRIILDVRLHRGELTRRGGHRLPRRADRLRAPQRAGRGQAGTRTARPTRCRTCWAGRCCSSCAPTSRRGSATRSRCATSTTRCSERLAADQLPSPPPRGRGPLGRAGHPGDRPRGRAVARRLLAGRRRPAIGAPTDRPERIVERFVGQGAPLIHLVDFDGARSGSPANLEAVGAVASRVAVPLQLAGGVDTRRRDPPRLRRRRDPRRPDARPSPTGPTTLRDASPSPATGWPSVSTRGPSGWPRSRGAEPDRRPSRRSSPSWSRPASAGSCWPMVAAPPTRRSGRTVVRSLRCGDPRRRRGPRPRRHPPPARRRRRRRHPRRGRSSPGPSTFPPPWRPPHDPSAPRPARRHRHRSPSRILLAACTGPAVPGAAPPSRPPSLAHRRRRRRPPRSPRPRRPAATCRDCPTSQPTRCRPARRGP